MRQFLILLLFISYKLKKTSDYFYTKFVIFGDDIFLVEIKVAVGNSKKYFSFSKV